MGYVVVVKIKALNQIKALTFHQSGVTPDHQEADIDTSLIFFELKQTVFFKPFQKMWKLASSLYRCSYLSHLFTFYSILTDRVSLVKFQELCCWGIILQLRYILIYWPQILFW